MCDLHVHVYIMYTEINMPRWYASRAAGSRLILVNGVTVSRTFAGVCQQFTQQIHIHSDPFSLLVLIAQSGVLRYERVSLAAHIVSLY